MASRIELIRRRRATRPARGTRLRVPVQAHPHGLEREYGRALDSIVRAMHARVMAAVPGMFLAEDQDETSPLDEILRRIGVAEAQTMRTVSRTRARLLAQGVGEKVDRFNKRAMGEQIKAVIGVDPLASPTTPGAAPVLLERFARENVALIRSVPERYFEQVRELVVTSHAMGRRAGAVSALLQERFGVAQFNADRIARDQVSKLNSRITGARHKALGINAYLWRTSRDERVRPEHADLEGERFATDGPGAPGEGHPGDAVLCRCRREPDLSGLLG